MFLTELLAAAGSLSVKSSAAPAIETSAEYGVATKGDRRCEKVTQAVICEKLYDENICSA